MRIITHRSTVRKSLLSGVYLISMVFESKFLSFVTQFFFLLNHLYPRFLRLELGWKQPKVDELLLPIIQKMNKRRQDAALNKQGNLNEFLDVSAGSGTYAPRKSRAFQSKRLHEVISEFRKKKRQQNGSNTPDPASQPGDGDSQGENEDVETEEGMSRKRQRTTMEKKGGTTTPSRGKGKFGTSSAVARGNGGKGRRKGRGGTCRTRARKSKNQESLSELSEEDVNEDGDNDEFVPGPAKDSEAVEVNLRPRPRPRPTYKGVRDPAVEVTGGGEVSVLNVGNASPDVLPEAAMGD